MQEDVSLEDLPLLEHVGSQLAQHYFEGDVREFTAQLKMQLEADSRLDLPGSIEKAGKYGSAIQTGHNPAADTADEKEEFSGFYTTNKPFGVCDDPDRFGPMGVGYATYFFWFKLLVVLVVVPFMIVNIGHMWANYIGKSCYSTEQLDLNYRLLDKIVKSNHTATPIELAGLEQGETGMFVRNGSVVSQYLLIICRNKVGMEDCQDFSDKKCELTGTLTPYCSQLAMEMYLGRYKSFVCQKSAITLLSIGNVIGNAYNEHILEPPVLVAVGLAFVMIMYFHAWHRTKDRVLNERFLTLDDISLRFVNIPTDIENPYQMLKAALVKADPRYEPKRISLLFNTDYLHKATEQLEKLQRAIILHKSKHKAVELGSEPDATLRDLEAKKSTLLEGISACTQDFNSGKSANFLGEAYVSFETTRLTKEAHEAFRKKWWRVCCCKHKLRIGESAVYSERADHPRDIVWKNLHVKKWERFWRSLVATMISALAFVFNLFLFFNVHIRVEDFLERHSGGWITKIVELGAAGVVVIGEGILVYVMQSLAEFRKPSTVTKDSASKAQRVWLVLFANSGLLPLIIAVNSCSFFGQIGLLKSIHNYMLINMLLLPGIKTAKVVGRYMLQIVARAAIKKVSTEEGLRPDLFQDTLNMLWKPQDFDMSVAYSGAMKIATIAFFYMPMLPIAGVYLLVTLGLVYWADKLILVKYSNKVVNYSGYISKQLLGDLELLIALFIAGMCLKSALLSAAHQISPKIFNGSLIVPIMLCLLSYFEVFRTVSNIFIRVKDTSTPKQEVGSGGTQQSDVVDNLWANYEEVRKHDPHEYHMANPAKTFFHLHPDQRLMGGDSSALSPPGSFH